MSRLNAVIETDMSPSFVPWTITALPTSLYLSVAPAAKQSQICRDVWQRVCRRSGLRAVPPWHKTCATAAALGFLCSAILHSAGLSHISGFVRDDFGALQGNGCRRPELVPGRLPKSG